MLDNKWKDHSSEANSLNFKNKDSSLFVEYKNGSATFFLTDDLNYVPKEDEEMKFKEYVNSVEDKNFVIVGEF